MRYFEKQALIGPLVDLGWIGLPSLVGYQMGRTRGKEVAHTGKGESSTLGMLLRSLLVPGAIGYEIGKSNAISDYDMPKRKRRK